MSDDYINDEVLDYLEEQDLLREATTRYTQTDSYQARLKSAYERLYHYYSPQNGDQWPEDAVLRPGKIHITSNIIRPAVDVDARLQSILPRISNVTDHSDDDTMRKAEAAEQILLRFLELSGWDTWMSVFCQGRSLYGKGVLKPVWNKGDKRPDVVVVENPANLRIGWGSSDYSVKDWGLYEYALSPEAAMRKWPGLVIANPTKGKDKPLSVMKTGDHTDPLGQKLPAGSSGLSGAGELNRLLARPTPYQPSDYEDKQVAVWDYWYKKPDGTVCNAVIVGRQVVATRAEHPEYPDIPYIISENDHDPGNPEGVSTAAPIIDLQIEMNRALSHWAQLVADELDPAWQIDADSVPAGIVPRGGEIVAAGEGKTIAPIPKGVNQFPLAELVKELWNQFHRRTGLSEILFGQTPSADISGRALAVQVEAAIMRLDPRRRRLYASLRELLGFWAHMTEKVNPTMTVKLPDAEGNLVDQDVPVGPMVAGFTRWKIVAPEITPRDLLEATTNVSNKVNAKLVSLRTGMDELGVDSPEKEIDTIKRERMDANLFPGDVNAYVAVVAALAQMQQTMQQMQQTVQQIQGSAAGQQQALAQGAQPQGVQGDNGSSPPMPATAPGGAPPAGATGPAGIAGTTLVRARPDGGAQTLNQLAINQRY
jgi:hypothetical protein